MKICTMSFILLCVLYCMVKAARAEQHTLQYLYTLRSAPEDEPEFEITTVFDGLIISHCESPSFRDQSRQEWIHQAFNAEEWKNRDRFCEGEYYFHKTLIEKIQQIINTTNGLIQRERSCTADDSEVSMSDRWGVNAEDFLTLDPVTLKWRSESSLARTVRSEFNQKKFMAPSLKSFLSEECKPTVMTLKKKKADYLKQNQSPDLYVFGKSSPDSDTVSLRCYVSHKFLPGVRVRLTLDGEVLDKNVDVSSPSPNMDGSLQIRLQTETSMKQPDRYHCMVDTDNLHVSIGWDGQTLDEKTLHQEQVSKEFHLHYLVLFLIVVVITLLVVVAVKGGIFAGKKDYVKRNKSINNAVQVFLSLVQSEEEWEREAEADDEYHGPMRFIIRILRKTELVT
ncbi:class I histocompatibility antigen, F10 alpha chain-like [Pygocentrus nattereri]|uniref:Ig-like domain-containing protein n=1 Tax=Pygocentrus nattereri TaxID=42514 RepID=A0AAR2L5I2_PYGNA|nr:class I histocompatibility antigen, F10 alpha chain-like [Pygocentrus nattereri]